jgi:predicted dehydrogenase
LKQLRTVVVGLGRIGWQFHLPQIARHDGFDLAAVVDPLDERRQEADAEYRVPGYTDLQSCVEDMAVDLVVLASPTPMHAEHAETAFAAGSDVFCDKPMAPDLAAACSTNYGVHLIDACLHVARAPAAKITCHLRTIASLGDADDVVKALIETENSVLLDIDINMASAQPMLPRWHVVGRHGSLVLDEDEKCWCASYFDPKDAMLRLPRGM